MEVSQEKTKNSIATADATGKIEEIMHSRQQPPSLRESVRKIAETTDRSARRKGCQLLYLYIVNLSRQPDNPRYRKIYTTNESFLQVDTLSGARDLLHSVGFEENNSGYLEWKHLKDDSAASRTTGDQQLAPRMRFLEQAASALSILKSQNDPEDLVETALSCISPELFE